MVYILPSVASLLQAPRYLRPSPISIATSVPKEAYWPKWVKWMTQMPPLLKLKKVVVPKRFRHTKGRGNEAPQNAAGAVAGRGSGCSRMQHLRALGQYLEKLGTNTEAATRRELRGLSDSRSAERISRWVRGRNCASYAEASNGGCPEVWQRPICYSWTSQGPCGWPVLRRRRD